MCNCFLCFIDKRNADVTVGASVALEVSPRPPIKYFLAQRKTIWASSFFCLCYLTEWLQQEPLASLFPPRFSISFPAARKGKENEHEREKENRARRADQPAGRHRGRSIIAENRPPSLPFNKKRSRRDCIENVSFIWSERGDLNS